MPSISAPSQPFATKTDWIYNALRERIRAGKLKPDGRLRLTALARSFATSEMPVREALRMLQRDGLIEMQSHRGAVVANPSLARVHEIISVRTHLELLAIREAAAHHDAKSLAGLRRLLERLDRLAARGQAGTFSEVNRKFHTALYEPCAMAVLKEEIRELWDRAWRSRSESLFALRRHRMIEAQKEHWAIYDAVAAADPQKAAAALERHRDCTLAAWRELVEQAQVISPRAP